MESRFLRGSLEFALELVNGTVHNIATLSCCKKRDYPVSGLLKNVDSTVD